jgi:hypothetical protein
MLGDTDWLWFRVAPCDAVKTWSDLLRNSPRKCSRHAGAAQLRPICIVCACEEIHCDCIAVSKCNT